MGGYAGFVWPAYGLAFAGARRIVAAFLAALPRQRRGARPRCSNAGRGPMTRKQRRLTVLALGLAALAAATALVLFAFNDNLVFFYSPSELAAKPVAPDRRIRIGGLVEAQSLKRLRRAAASRSASPTARTMWSSSMTAFCRICSARGRASSPRANCAPTACFVATQCARQARREIHAARSRRRAEEERAAGRKAAHLPAPPPRPATRTQ